MRSQSERVESRRWEETIEVALSDLHAVYEDKHRPNGWHATANSQPTLKIKL
jgi:hypothetical protein